MGSVGWGMWLLGTPTHPRREGAQPHGRVRWVRDLLLAGLLGWDRLGKTFCLLPMENVIPAGLGIPWILSLQVWDTWRSGIPARTVRTPAPRGWTWLIAPREQSQKQEAGILLTSLSKVVI